MAVSPAKKPTTKTAVKKPTTAKKPVAKKAAPKKTSPKARKISAEERYKMVEIAAYYIAEHNHFQGSPVDFWIAAEAEVAAKLS
jgi:hypothetical protein